MLRAAVASGDTGAGQASLAAGHAACERHPGDPRALTRDAEALLALGQTGPAVGALMVALTHDAADAAAHGRLANALLQHGDLAQGMVHALEAFRLAPERTQISGMLLAVGAFAEALAFADLELTLRPGSAMALLNRAVALEGLHRFTEASGAAERALAAAPDDAGARYHLACLQLRGGAWTARAWDLFEARLPLAGLSPAPGWAGEALPGGTILLQAEQGLGDTLQFVRYAPLVAARVARVILAAPPPLLRLLRDAPGCHSVVATDVALPRFDVSCRLMSLPRIFATTLESIPPPQPYAAQPPPWQRPPALRVGLVWAGNPRFRDDRLRSVPPAALAALAGIPGVHFYSLQHPAAALPPSLAAVNLMTDVQDFADTAALVAGLDLVVSADTAVAHLAATMGKPVWLLSRTSGCWRWLRDRVDSPWYPTVRIVRQARPHDWGPVIDQVRLDLSELARRC